VTTYCIGVDVGGTFTDAVLADGEQTWRAKTPTTPHDVGEGVVDAVQRVATAAGQSLPELLPAVKRLGLGTTAITNVLASRTGQRVGLLATRGFEQMLPLARGERRNDSDGWLAPPAGIVEQSAIAGIGERIDRNGAVVEAIDVDEVLAAGRRLVDAEGVRALAVSFLWSFKNPSHEQQAVAALASEFDDIPITSGADLRPGIREYERTTFAVLNAYVAGAFAGIDKLADDLAELGLAVPLLLVNSAGGSVTVSEARRLPLELAASGPAAGVAASVAVAAASDVHDVVTCDMGGTSFDVSVVTAGAPARRIRGELMGVWTALSLVDVQSIGAGGGSLGWIDARGMLRVGPRSAGAVPGPASYGRGGTEPTVTDALVTLGFIDPDRFLGGQMRLDADAARAACGRLGEQLGLGGEEVAWGIRELSLAGMAKAVRSRLGERGLDPRHQALLSYGGSGALFTPDIARSLGARTVLMPELASVLSAFGAATTDIRRERIRSMPLSMPADVAVLTKAIDELRAEVNEDLAADGVAEPDRSIDIEADLRFSKQIFEIPVGLPAGGLDEKKLAGLLDDFRAEYTRRYGQGSVVLGAPIELISLLAIGLGRTFQASLDTSSSKQAAAAAAQPDGARSVRLSREAAGAVRVPVFDRATLHNGHRLEGPALIDGKDTTIWLPPDSRGRIDPQGTLVLEVRP
jgi:N-methylhydantoinase A